jgi:RND family efflux transporter MFP subunit
MTKPNPRRLLLVGVAALVIACAIATKGIVQRAESAQEVARWTQQQAVPTVALAKLGHGGPSQPLTLPGTIQAYYKAAIYARVSGYVKSWAADIGAHVKAGQELATIDTPDLDQQLAQGQADLATATANAQLAAVTAQRWNSLVTSQWVSRQDADNKNGAAASTKAAMDAASANVKRLEAMEIFKNIVAPFDGVVTARNTDLGALINAGNAGQELFEVSDLHQVRIYVQVPQAFAAALTPGLKANFVMPQTPGRQFEATVVTTSNAINANSRSMLVELQADNAAGKFFPGAYCQVTFQLPGDPNMVRVPATALISADRNTEVAIAGNDNKVTIRPVQIGRDLGNSVEVVAGLSASDRVIDSPPETLQNGDQIALTANAATAVAAAASATKTD